MVGIASFTPFFTAAANTIDQKDCFSFLGYVN